MANHENETTIQCNDVDPGEEDVARIWSCQAGFHARMAKLGVEPTRKAERKPGYPFSAWYIVPRSWVQVRPPKKMNYTEEQRKAVGERLRNGRFPSAGQKLPNEFGPIDPEDEV